MSRRRRKKKTVLRIERAIVLDLKQYGIIVTTSEKGPERGKKKKKDQ